MTPPLVVDRHVVDDQGAALGQRVVGPLQQSLFGVPSPVVQHELSKCGRPPVAESLFPLAQLAGVGDAKTHVVEAGSPRHGSRPQGTLIGRIGGLAQLGDHDVLPRLPRGLAIPPGWFRR